METHEKMTKEQIDEQYPSMLEDLKWHLIKEQIAKKNNVKIEDGDLTGFAKRVAQAQFAQYGMASVPADVLENYAKEMMKNKEHVNQMVDQIMDEKIMTIVKNTIKLNKKSVSMEDFNKLFENK